MIDIIIATLALAMVQIWLLPMSISMHNFAWLLSARDEPSESSVLQQRVERAKHNLQESLPAALALFLLALHMDVDISTTATYWLGLRIIYVPIYMAGGTYLRTAAWIGSIVCLVQMALQLV
mgnify:FL=1|jgi:uncharacterized MAPEG superfamily protein